MSFYGDFLGKLGKIYRENEKSSVFPESRYFNSNRLGLDFSTRRSDFLLMVEKLLLPFFP